MNTINHNANPKYVIINMSHDIVWWTPGAKYVVGEDPHTYNSLEEAQESRDMYAEDYDNDQLVVMRCIPPRQPIVPAPKLFNELVGILHCFDRDDIPAHFEQRPSGKGVRVFITYPQAQRIRSLTKEVQP